ncbi:MAG: WGR domain-containing protein [Spirochaetales bacterium]|nr:WGR domain-containing protein [Spirochaetales bacterium]
MRRFEYKDSKSNKFWEIELKDITVTVHFGRIGSSGQAAAKRFTTRELAEKEYNKLISSKIKKGYKEVAVQTSSAAKRDSGTKNKKVDTDAAPEKTHQAKQVRFRCFISKNAAAWGVNEKYWRINRTGNTLSIYHGPLGRIGSFSEEAFESDEKAGSELEKKIAGKIKEGFEEIPQTEFLSEPVSVPRAERYEEENGNQRYWGVAYWDEFILTHKGGRCHLEDHGTVENALLAVDMMIFAATRKLNYRKVTGWPRIKLTPPEFTIIDKMPSIYVEAFKNRGIGDPKKVFLPVRLKEYLGYAKINSYLACPGMTAAQLKSLFEDPNPFFKEQPCFYYWFDVDLAGADGKVFPLRMTFTSGFREIELWGAFWDRDTQELVATVVPEDKQKSLVGITSGRHKNQYKDHNALIPEPVFNEGDAFGNLNLSAAHGLEMEKALIAAIQTGRIYTQRQTYELYNNWDPGCFEFNSINPDNYCIGPLGTGTTDIISLTNIILISKTNVPEKLWQKVCNWALNHGYAFKTQVKNNDGFVWGLNWADSIVFCNAFSEMQNFDSVYYLDPEFRLPCRDASVDGMVYANWGANGFRLPTEIELMVAGLRPSVFYWDLSDDEEKVFPSARINPHGNMKSQKLQSRFLKVNSMIFKLRLVRTPGPGYVERESFSAADIRRNPGAELAGEQKNLTPMEIKLKRLAESKKEKKPMVEKHEKKEIEGELYNGIIENGDGSWCLNNLPYVLDFQTYDAGNPLNGRITCWIKNREREKTMLYKLCEVTFENGLPCGDWKYWSRVTNNLTHSYDFHLVLEKAFREHSLKTTKAYVKNEPYLSADWDHNACKDFEFHDELNIGPEYGNYRIAVDTYKKTVTITGGGELSLVPRQGDQIAVFDTCRKKNTLLGRQAAQDMFGQMETVMIDANRAGFRIPEPVPFFRHLFVSYYIFPDNLFLFENVERLTVRYNLLGESTNIDRMPKVRKLCLQGPVFPSEIGKLKDLEEITFYGSGEIPGSIGELKNLKKLMVGTGALEKNVILKIPPAIGECGQLREIELTGIPLFSLPGEIGHLSHLTKLTVTNTFLTEIPDSIGKLSLLEELDLGGNLITNVPWSIGELSNLRSLNLASNQIGSLPSEIGKLAGLVYFNVKNNLLSELPEDIGRLSRLEELDLANNVFRLFPLPVDNNLISLKLLHMESVDERFRPRKTGDYNRITKVPDIALPSLEILYMGNNGITEFPRLTRLKKLKSLLLDGNRIEKIPAFVMEMDYVCHFNVSGNPLKEVAQELFASEGKSIRDLVGPYKKLKVDAGLPKVRTITGKEELPKAIGVEDPLLPILKKIMDRANGYELILPEKTGKLDFMELLLARHVMERVVINRTVEGWATSDNSQSIDASLDWDEGDIRYRKKAVGEIINVLSENLSGIGAFYLEMPLIAGSTVPDISNALYLLMGKTPGGDWFGMAPETPDERYTAKMGAPIANDNNELTPYASDLVKKLESIANNFKPLYIQPNSEIYYTEMKYASAPTRNAVLEKILLNSNLLRKYIFTGLEAVDKDPPYNELNNNVQDVSAGIDEKGSDAERFLTGRLKDTFIYAVGQDILYYIFVIGEILNTTVCLYTSRSWH